MRLGRYEKLKISKGKELFRKVVLLFFALLLALPILVPQEAHAADLTIDTIGKFENFLTDGKTYAGQLVVLTINIDYGGGTLPKKLDFKGTFDGQGNEIKNFQIVGKSGTLIPRDPSAEQDVGLFKQLSGTAIVKNLKIIGGTVIGGERAGVLASNIDSSNIGGIAGQMIDSAKIENCSFTGTVEGKGNSEYVGGIAGKMSGNAVVTGSSITGTVKKPNSPSRNGNYFGGIAGGMSGEAKIINSRFDGTVITSRNDSYFGGITGAMSGNAVVMGSSITGTVETTGTGSYFGGITGTMNDNAKIANTNVDTGTVKTTSTGSYFGGITGAMSGNVNVTGCNFTGGVKISGGEYAGGIVGRFDGGSIENCSAGGSIAGAKTVEASGPNIGGIAGGQYTLGGTVTIKNSHFDGKVKGTDNVGGIIGLLTEGTNLVEACSISGSQVVEGNNAVGGIVGKQNNGIINQCQVNGTTEGSTNTVKGNEYTGGIVGQLIKGNVYRCQLDGNVTGLIKVGGIAGLAGSNTRIENSATVSGSAIEGTGGSSNNETRVGGIAGDHAGTICNSVNFANVQGKYAIGGIAGYLNGNGAAMASCVNAGKITVTDSNGGGLVGKISSNNSSLVHKCVNWGKVLGNGSNKGSIGGFVFSNLNAKYNFYQTYTGAPNAYTNGDSGATNYAGAYVEGNDVSPEDLSWHGLVEGDGVGYVKFLNWPTDCGCSFDPENPPYYLDPNYDWMPMVGLDGPVQPPVKMDVCITSGIEYLMPESPWEDEVAITNDSVLTIAYRFGVNIGCPPSRLALSFKISDEPDPVQLPVGSRITVMTKGKYYYKILTGTEDKLQLTEFYEMGSTTDKFQGTTWGGEEDRDFLVSLDFTNVPYDDRLSEGTYDIVFLPLYGTTLTEYPKMDIKKQNFHFGGAGGTNGFYLELIAEPETVGAYNHLVDDKEFGIEFYIEDENGKHLPLPLGSVVNGVPISRKTPYQILPFSILEEYHYTIVLPPGYEGYSTATAIAYASENSSLPRGGHHLLKDSAGINFTADTTGDGYAIKTDINFKSRFLGYSSENRYISASLESIHFPGSVLKYTLQKKYGSVYSNMSGQVDKNIGITNTINLEVPAGLEKGTYRFIITLYDKEGEEGKAQTRSIENFIIK